MKKICIITNIPSPYRVDLFVYLQRSLKEYKIYIIFSCMTEDNRDWNSNCATLDNFVFLKSKTIKIKKQFFFIQIICVFAKILYFWCKNSVFLQNSYGNFKYCAIVLTIVWKAYIIIILKLICSLICFQPAITNPRCWQFLLN